MTRALGAVLAATSIALAVAGSAAAAPANGRPATRVLTTAAHGPANDDFVHAEPLSHASGQISRTNVNATEEAGEPNHAGDEGGASIWFTLTPRTSGAVALSTDGSDFDVLLAVYTGPFVQALTPVAPTADLGGRSQQGSFRFDAEGGITYRIAVDGRRTNGVPGSGSVNLSWTAPAGQKLILAGDIASCESTGDEATATLVDGYPRAAVQTLGDNAYESGSAQDFADCYGPSWGRFKSRTRPAVGNHDYDTPGAAGYFGYFGSAAGDPARGYYSYDLGDWHVVVLNSECWEIGGCFAGSPQETWLRADLAASPTTCTMAIVHRPLFTSSGVGPFTNARPLYRALYTAGADVVVSGHAHSYERFAPQTPAGVLDDWYGLQQFVAGTGGEEHLPFVTKSANSEVRDNTSFGILVMTLRAGAYEWEFDPVAGAGFSDSGARRCHGAPRG